MFYMLYSTPHRMIRSFGAFSLPSRDSSSGVAMRQCVSDWAICLTISPVGFTTRRGGFDRFLRFVALLVFVPSDAHCALR